MIVYGKNVFKETINSDKKINQIYLSNSFDDKDILEDIANNNIRVIKMDKKQMDRKFEGNHQGIVLDIEDYKYKSIKDVLDKNFVVMLDHLEDPHNLGAIIRTAESAGVDAIIIPNKRSVQITGTVMKVSAGPLSNIDVVEVSNLANAIDTLKDNGFWVYSSCMDGEDYSKVKYDSKTCLIIGSEGDGVSKLVKDKSDFIIGIPMKGKVNSLNASVAAGILIYEVIKQKGE